MPPRERLNSDQLSGRKVNDRLVGDRDFALLDRPAQIINKLLQRAITRRQLCIEHCDRSPTNTARMALSSIGSCHQFLGTQPRFGNCHTCTRAESRGYSVNSATDAHGKLSDHRSRHDVGDRGIRKHDGHTATPQPSQSCVLGK